MSDPPKLPDQVKNLIRLRRYSIKTEETDKRDALKAKAHGSRP